MDQADTALNRIYQINRAAIRDVNSERDAALIRNQPIALGETLVGLHRRVDHRDTIAMHLPSGEEGRMFEP